MRLLTVNAGSYTVYIGSDVFRELNRTLNYSRFKRSRLFVLTDENSLRCCYPLLAQAVKRVRGAEIIEIPSGEQNKNIDVCRNIWAALSSLGADRASLLLNLGGGVVGDMGGFAAATFKRGISFINIPTTLLAQVDASVGGKLGIDLDHLKNEVGVFGDPAGVFIYPAFLDTLDERQLLSGYAEVVKHALIADEKYWELLRAAGNPAGITNREKIIYRSVQIKNAVVRKDPEEKGLRKVLNFGHTIGHAVETFSLENARTPLLHGEAIAIGMVCETFLSNLKCRLNKSLLNEITSFILHTFRTVKLDKFDDHRLIELMRHDKKNSGGKINFSLISAIGSPRINKACTAEEIRKALNYYREQANLVG